MLFLNSFVNELNGRADFDILCKAVDASAEPDVYKKERGREGYDIITGKGKA